MKKEIISTMVCILPMVMVYIILKIFTEKEVSFEILLIMIITTIITRVVLFIFSKGNKK